MVVGDGQRSLGAVAAAVAGAAVAVGRGMRLWWWMVMREEVELPEARS